MTPTRDKYKIVFDPNDPKKWVVQLTAACAPFNGVLYSYGEFFAKDTENGMENAKLNFQTEIIYVPEHLRGVEFPDEVSIEMDKLLGEILFDIIETHAHAAKTEDGKLFLEIVRDDK